MLTHIATIRGRAITWDHREVVQHGLNADRVELVTDREWQECDRVIAVLAKAGKESVRVDAGDGFNIPSALMEDAGPLRMCLLGYKGDSVRIVTAKEDAPLCVVESGEVAGMDPAPEQPDLWAQLMEEVRKATDGAKTAAQSATRAEADLRAAAERGDFDGEDGKTPVRGVDYWTAEDRKPIEDATLAATTAAGRADAAAATATEGEASRVAAETARANAETAREGAETGRVEAEATRAANESERAETFNANLISWNGKVDAACKKATDTASKAAQDAKTATDAAIAQTQEATNAAVAKADKATASATTAANKAEAAVSKLPLPLGNTLKGEAESTMVSVHDAYPAPLVETKVMGQSNQVTTTGKNLINGMESFYKASESPSILRNYCWGYSLGQNPLKLTKPLKPGTYTFSLYTDDLVAIYFSQSPYGGTNEMFTVNHKLPNDIRNGLNRYYGTVELKNESDIIGAYSDYSACCCGMLNEGTEPLPYEPYTGGKPSPSPDYPQEITNLNKAEIVTTGKNLFCIPSVIKNDTGLSIQHNDNGTLVVNGEINTDKYLSLLDGSEGFMIPERTQVILSGAPKNVYFNIGSRSSVGTADSISGSLISCTNGIASIGIIANGTRAVHAHLKFCPGKYSNVIVQPQIEAGLTATAYEQHQSTVTPIDLKGNELCSLPNGVNDEVVIDAEGNVSLIKRVAKVNLETLIAKRIQRQSNGKWLTYIAVPQIKSDYTAGCAICNKLVHVSNLESAAIHGNIFVGSNNLISLGIPENLYPNVDVEEIEATPQIKAWFDDIKVGTVVYGMATTPQIIPLGKVELPALPEATSNVWNDGNIPANVYINYLKDVNIAFADLESKLTQAVVAAAANL